MIRSSLRLNKREYVAAYILASLANFLIITPSYLAALKGLEAGLSPLDPTQEALVSSYGSATGLILDALRSMAIYQGIITIVVLGVAVSGAAARRWRWQFVTTSILFIAYVGYRLATRFGNTLDWVVTFASRGIETSGTLVTLYLFGLAAALCYTALVLILRRWYSKLSSIRLDGESAAVSDQKLIIPP